MHDTGPTYMYVRFKESMEIEQPFKQNKFMLHSNYSEEKQHSIEIKSMADYPTKFGMAALGPPRSRSPKVENWQLPNDSDDLFLVLSFEFGTKKHPSKCTILESPNPFCSRNPQNFNPPLNRIKCICFKRLKFLKIQNVVVREKLTSECHEILTKASRVCRNLIDRENDRHQQQHCDILRWQKWKWSKWFVWLLLH